MRQAAARLILESCEAFVALLCALSSLAYLGGAPEPRSVDVLLPGWMLFAWGVYLLLGGVLTITGLVIGRRQTEKAGLLLLAGSATVYALAVLVSAGLAGLFPAGITLAFAAAFGVRASNRIQRLALRWLA